MFSRVQIWVLSGCALVIVLGGALLLVDRFFVRADEPPEAVRRAEAIETLSLEEVRDVAALEHLSAAIQPFAPLFGEVRQIDAVLRQQQASATLWLVEFRSRHRDAALDRGLSYTGVDAPRMMLLVELATDPGWQPFIQASADAMPAELPPAWHARLARMAPYRMGIHQGRVAFVSQLEGSALVQSIEARTSPEFHPGLLNSALRVEVQQALDIVSALPGAPGLERFYRIDVDVRLPEIDRSALVRAQAQRQATQIKLDAELSELRQRMAEQRAEFRQRNQENLERFRERSKASQARVQAGTAAPKEPATTASPTEESRADTDAAADGTQPP